MGIGVECDIGNRETIVDEEADTVVVFKGFSSSLVRPTAYDPEVPTIPAGVKIVSIDRVRGPYVPETPDFIERAVSLAAFEARLLENGL